MKPFIYKTFIFIGISISLISITFIFTNSLIDRNAKFSFRTPVNNVIFGHSHSECAFNDSLINNFKNLSQSRQSYFYSFQKIKKVISQNNDIKNVFVEFSNNQIGAGMDKWIWDDLSISSRSIYFPFLEKEDINLLINKNSKSFITGASKSFRNNLMNLLLFNYDYTNKIGGYQWLKRDKTDSLIINFKKDTIHFSRKKNDLSIKNIEYLEKIINFCQGNDVNIYLVRSPQHKYYDRNNEKEFIKIWNKKFKDIDFLDFNNFPLNNEEFGDFGHLNYKGAKIFSLWFNELLEKGLLSMENKSEFIISEMEQVRTHNKVYKSLGNK
jgi:hypothetical protein|tara:strand:- start:605 stop:1579 length:975 start_codon:yes stop_codon:yes gene_type:complete